MAKIFDISFLSKLYWYLEFIVRTNCSIIGFKPMVPEPLCSKIMIEHILLIFCLFCKILLVEEHIPCICMQRHYFQERASVFFKRFFVMYRFGNGAPICIVCIGWKSQCLPYAGFFMERFSRGLRGRLKWKWVMLLYALKICYVSISNYWELQAKNMRRTSQDVKRQTKIGFLPITL